MAVIKEYQLVSMNQHYKRFSLDYYLDCQQKVGFKNIELWLGASHFYVDSKGYDDVKPLKKKLKDRGLNVVSVTTPSIAYQYQYASQEKEILEQSFKYFMNGIRVAEELGADRAVINSGWGYINEDSSEMWKRCCDNISRICDEAQKHGIKCVMESLRDDESNIVNNLQTAQKMFTELKNPNLYMMVDSIATGRAGESLEQWFEAFGDSLIHMHFLDGDPYDHNVWGDGNTPPQSQIETMNRYGYTGYLVQEVADDKYFSDPYRADVKNMRVLSRFIEDRSIF